VSGSRTARDVRARRVTTAGTLSTPLEVRYGGAVGTPSVAGGAAGYVVVYTAVSDVGVLETIATRVARTGGVTGSSTLGPSPTAGAASAAVYDGAGFQLAWEHTTGGRNEIRGARLSTSGVVSPTGGRTLVPLGPTGALRTPALAVGGGTVLLAWLDFHSTARQTVSAQRLDAAGAPAGSSVVVSRAAGTAQLPTVTFEGTDFLVAWEIPGTLPQVHGARVTTAGALREAPVPIVQDATSPDLTSPGGGRAMILYHGFVFGPTANARLVRARLIDFTVPGERALGSACESSWTCASGACVDGVCCDRACGGGCEACSVARGASAEGVCTVRPAGTACRPGTGLCDAAELCDGVSGVCPPDAFLPAGTLCGELATHPCDLDDLCTGTSADCPLAARRPAGTVCRPAAGSCDLEETCTGGSMLCPADLMRPMGTVCRPSAGACDVAEVCDGSAAACPADAFVARGSLCRPSAGPCDLGEACDGRSAACPRDAFQPATTPCRGARGVCDAEERCTGTGAACPRDGLHPAGFPCRPADGACDLAEQCDGASLECPPDRVRPRGYVCRPAVGPCDVAEACDGTYPRCSIDRALVDGTSCDDGLACNGIDTCRAGVCMVGQAVTCEPGAECNEVLQACRTEPPPPGCGCRVGSRAAGWPALWLLGLLVLAWRRR
jgi:hypothetical protein